MNNVSGVVVCRICPLHLGHENMITKMFDECGVANSLIIIGSSNNPLSLRHFFSYEERRSFLLDVFPDARVVGLPDFNNDAEWMLALDDVLKLANVDNKKALYFGGCHEDIRFFEDDERTCRIVNRFDGSTVKISATEVRDALVSGRSLEGLINPKIQQKVQDTFSEKWEKFKKM